MNEQKTSWTPWDERDDLPKAVIRFKYYNDGWKVDVSLAGSLPEELFDELKGDIVQSLVDNFKPSRPKDLSKSDDPSYSIDVVKRIDLSRDDKKLLLHNPKPYDYVTAAKNAIEEIEKLDYDSSNNSNVQEEYYIDFAIESSYGQEDGIIYIGKLDDDKAFKKAVLTSKETMEAIKNSLGGSPYRFHHLDIVPESKLSEKQIINCLHLEAVDLLRDSIQPNTVSYQTQNQTGAQSQSWEAVQSVRAMGDTPTPDFGDVDAAGMVDVVSNARNTQNIEDIKEKLNKTNKLLSSIDSKTPNLADTNKKPTPVIQTPSKFTVDTIPPFEENSDNWIILEQFRCICTDRKEEGISTGTLRVYRSRGKKSKDENSGIDSQGNVWRSYNSEFYYWKDSSDVD